MLHVWKPLEKGMRLVSDTPGGGRLHRVVREIDYRATEAFFESRGKDAVGQPLVSTMYQDAGLASRRDAAEKETVLPHLAINGADRVLDVGCGAGRWAEVLVPRVAAYLGIDFSEGLLAAARTRTPGGAFQRMSASALDPGAFHLPPPFSLVICSGILIYLNDRDVENLLTLIAEISGPAARLYVREPVATMERLTLDGFWSEELQARYSAIYRTRLEYNRLFEKLAGFSLFREGSPISSDLQNRADTEQWFAILGRGAS
jgi:SAM-dependent methyltransferase